MDASSDSAVPLEELFPFQNDAEIVCGALKGMETAFKGKAGELTNDGIIVSFNQVVKPKLRPLLAGAFRDVEYFMSAECGGKSIFPLGPGLRRRAKGDKPRIKRRARNTTLSGRLGRTRGTIQTNPYREIFQQAA